MGFLSNRFKGGGKLGGAVWECFFLDGITPGNTPELIPPRFEINLLFESCYTSLIDLKLATENML